MDDNATQLAQSLQEPMKGMAQQMLQWMQSAGTFAQDQAPLIAHEIVARTMIESVLRAVGFFGAGFFLLWVSILLARKMDQECVEEKEFAFLVGVSGGVIAMVGGGTNIYYLLSAYFAPRLLVIEYLSRLLK